MVTGLKQCVKKHGHVFEKKILDFLSNFWIRKRIFEKNCFFFGERIDTQKKAKRNTHTHTQNCVSIKKLIIEKQNEVPKQSGVGGEGGGEELLFTRENV